MSWSSPPTKAVEARDRLLGLTSVSGAGFLAANFHYPRAAITDSLPLAVVERSSNTAKRIGNGTSQANGSIAIVFVFAASTPDGTLEDFADAVCRDAVETLTDGLFVVEATAERCGMAGPGLFASDSAGQLDQGRATSAIIVTLTWDF